MGRVYLCLGQNAEVPYYFERARVHIWNIEELCYFLKENIWALEPSLFSEGLTEWIGQQCALTQLAARLELTRKKEKAMENFVQELFGYTCYYEKQEVENLLKVLRANADTDEHRRRKSRGDYFLENGSFGGCGKVGIENQKVVLFAKVGKRLTVGFSGCYFICHIVHLTVRIRQSHEAQPLPPRTALPWEPDRATRRDPP